jgi:two-component system alkaline phosphatase synthesis response regulator PhoP
MSGNNLQKLKERYRLLLIDDDELMLESLKTIFEAAGFMVMCVNNGRDGIEAAKKFQPHLIILDLVMPGMDGIEVCQEIKIIPGLEKTLIAFYSARSEDYSQIAAFSAGADDYIVKPLHANVMIMRVQALFKRHRTKKLSKITQAGPIRIDRERYLVLKGEDVIILPKKEFELLALLIGSPKKVFTRTEIYREIWGEESGENSRTIDVHIRKIREKIGDDFIKTVKGIGYSFKIN